MIRQPIICVMGHVDHGKTTLLDKIRNTAIAAKEAGGITQHIGASEVPISTIDKIAGELLKKFNAKITIPGLLFIDTPGHAAFTNLRRRGGSVADLAILVVDITKSFEPQTYEAINILKEYKTPFIVAANKVDLITGWRVSGSNSLMVALESQSSEVVASLDSHLYELVGKLSELGFESERFDRVKNFQKEIVIVPLSAKTGEGIAELLVYVTGLAQRFLESRLDIEVKGPGIGSIIEKKEERGLGTTLDVILYNGTFSVNDKIAFAASTGITEAKIKALLKPKPLQELRDSASKFYNVDSVSAAAGIKISSNNIDDALPGSLIMSTEFPNYKTEILSEIQEVFATDKTGIILKADTIGSIEALSRLLKSEGINISKKELGNVTKRNVIDAFSMRGANPYESVIIAFNVGIDDDAEAESLATGVKIISNNVIYKIVDDYKLWINEEKNKELSAAEKALTLPGMVRVLPNTCFRVSHPAIFGVDVLSGRIKPAYLLMNKSGAIIGRIKEIQNEGTSLQEVKKGESAAISIEDAVFGRNVNTDDILYTYISDSDEMMLRGKFSMLLSDEEKDLLNEISKTKSQRH